MGGGIANFTSVAGTFTGIVKASSLRHAAKHTHHHVVFVAPLMWCTVQIWKRRHPHRCILQVDSNAAFRAHGVVLFVRNRL